MSLVQKIEAALAEVEGELSREEQVLVGWIKRLIHHHKAGDAIPPTPQAGAVEAAPGVGSGDAAVPDIAHEDPA